MASPGLRRRRHAGRLHHRDAPRRRAFSSAHILIQYKAREGAADHALEREARKLAQRVHALAIKEDANFACWRRATPTARRGACAAGAPPHAWPEMPRRTPTTWPRAQAQGGRALRGRGDALRLPHHQAPEVRADRASHILISFTDSLEQAREERKRYDAECWRAKCAPRRRRRTPTSRARGQVLDDAKTTGREATWAPSLLHHAAPFEQIAFALKVGQVSTSSNAMGFHIIKRTK